MQNGWSNLTKSDTNDSGSQSHAKLITQFCFFAVVIVFSVIIGSYIIRMTSRLAALPSGVGTPTVINSFAICRPRLASEATKTEITQSFFQQGASANSNSQEYYNRQRQAGNNIVADSTPCQAAETRVISTLYVK